MRIQKIQLKDIHPDFIGIVNDENGIIYYCSLTRIFVLKFISDKWGVVPIWEFLRTKQENTNLNEHQT